MEDIMLLFKKKQNMANHEWMYNGWSRGQSPSHEWIENTKINTVWWQNANMSCSSEQVASC